MHRSTVTPTKSSKISTVSNNQSHGAVSSWKVAPTIRFWGPLDLKPRPQKNRELANHRNPNAVPQWDGTKAQAILQQMIASGETADKKPAEIVSQITDWFTRPRSSATVTTTKNNANTEKKSSELASHMRIVQRKINV
jgi:hypothetical protein